MTVTTGARVTMSAAFATSASVWIELFFEAAHLDVGAELAREHRRGFGVERGVDRHHQPLHQQLAEDVLDAHVELVGEILDRHAFGQRDRPRDRRRRGRWRRRWPGADRGADAGRTGRWPASAAGMASAAAATACPDAADTGPVAAAGRAAACASAATAADADRPASAVAPVPDTRGVAAAGGRRPAGGRGPRRRRRLRSSRRRPRSRRTERRPLGRGRVVRHDARRAACVGSGGVGVVGRCSSMRSRSSAARRVRAPRAWRRLGSGCAAGDAAPVPARPRRAARVLRRAARRAAGAAAATRSPAPARSARAAPRDGQRLPRARGPAPAPRSAQVLPPALPSSPAAAAAAPAPPASAARAPSWRAAGFLPLGDRRLGEDVAGRQRDVALLREAIDELPRDDLFDRARRALHLDAVIALEQRRHFLARRAEQLRDLVNPDS